MFEVPKCPGYPLCTRGALKKILKNIIKYLRCLMPWGPFVPVRPGKKSKTLLKYLRILSAPGSLMSLQSKKFPKN